MLVPPGFAKMIAAREGSAGRKWVASLPDVVAQILERWSCRRDGRPRHGRVGLIVPVVCEFGDAVIKVSFSARDSDGEAHALRLLGGSAAVRLYAHDAEHAATLLERADGPRPNEVLDAEDSVQMMGELAARIAMPAPPEMTRLANTAPGWRRQLDDQARLAPTGTATRTVLKRAREAIELLAADTTTTLVHGDLYEGNVLGAEREPWLSIDLKGWAGTAAYDAWTVAMTRHHDLRHVNDPADLVRQRIHRFAVASGVDPQLAIELAHARAVSSLLYETVSGDVNYGPRLLGRIVTSSL